MLGLLSVSHAAQAQQDVFADSTPEERAEMQTTYMTELLVLTDSTQISEIRAIHLKYARTNEEVVNGGGRRLSKLRQLKTLNEDKEKELERVLTDEQFAVYLHNKEEMKQRMKERMREGRSEGP